MTFIILVLFLINCSVFAQDYTNNQQYFDNPETGIVHQKDIFDEKEIITLKSNIMKFTTPQAKINLNFSFTRDLSDILQQSNIELILSVCSDKMLMPYDNFEQTIELTVSDRFYTYLWKEIFYFDRREFQFSINKQGKMELILKKSLTSEEFIMLSSLFAEDQQVLFSVKGFYGKINFGFSKEITNFYKYFFDYKFLIYNN